MWVKEVVLGVETWRREAGAIVAEVTSLSLSGMWLLRIYKRTQDQSQRTLAERKFPNLLRACEFAGREWFYE